MLPPIPPYHLPPFLASQSQVRGGGEEKFSQNFLPSTSVWVTPTCQVVERQDCHSSCPQGAYTLMGSALLRQLQ